MKREVITHGLVFHIGNRTPRRNEYEKGLKYILFVDGVPTNFYFSTIREAKQFIKNDFWRWL